MDLVPPVTAGLFAPQQRTLRRRGSEPDDLADRDIAERDAGEVSLRPNPMLANMNMLLEILSEAGTPANTSLPLKSMLRQPARRYEDFAADEDPRAQYHFDFTE